MQTWSPQRLDFTSSTRRDSTAFNRVCWL